MYQAIKIAIKLRPDGSSHPIGHDGYEIDQYGIGMHYCNDDCPSDANGFRYGLTALPKDRADAYIARAGGGVVAITDIEAEAWFATHKKESSQLFNNDILTSIKLKKDLAIPLTPEDNEALDPTNQRAGIVNNLKRGYLAKLPK